MSVCILTNELGLQFNKVIDPTVKSVKICASDAELFYLTGQNFRQHILNLTISYKSVSEYIFFKMRYLNLQKRHTHTRYRIELTTIPRPTVNREISDHLPSCMTGNTEIQPARCDVSSLHPLPAFQQPCMDCGPH